MSPEHAYDYFDHDADVGVEGHGPTLEAALEAVAAGTFALMADPSSVGTAEALRVEFEETDPELALVTWVNRLLGEARAEGLILGRFALERTGDQWRGEAWGEHWRADLDRGVEVKGATLTMLRVEPMGDGWEARCVIDV